MFLFISACSIPAMNVKAAGASNRASVLLQRGHVVFVPKSHVGNGISSSDGTFEPA
ncbi:hypothetical protein [Pseudomonas sp. MWU13-2105]|uniref:hypothetical protein n=1 Tax=Pseudomonas sp. MWU13-2105 TaxID=2935074 RepID=UPI00200F3253|nr:hypothetical protein [Pseudomonas sp. MWU13-2105]